MDGPSVNCKFLEISKERKVDKQHLHINIDSCGLHTIHVALKAGAENAKSNTKQTLKGPFQVFHSSPARQDVFEPVTGTKVYPLFLYHQVGKALEARKTTYAICSYQLPE